MNTRFKPKFEDCRDCRFYSPSRPSPLCVRCGAGEFFEERIDDDLPDERELMTYLSRMEDNDDE
ncbi:hypothetical protein SAMN05216548_11425 [Faunimonas pinastri]|uniref:Uncharacterized protein n=1 Tax=Faunimonas pinastri TaxID=1855383 RepID=A0A1H9MSN1_9HYPH|nr:hypothetical protein [Faunimonas pinastri]SER26497.1 hypothetical protein SAMN05216548_11425 [Faunimonas pinastri]